MIFENKIALWVFIQGFFFYTIFPMVLMAYPQIFDLFFDNLSDYDYIYGQLLLCLVMMISFYYNLASFSKQLNQMIVSFVIGEECASNIKGSAQSFAYGAAVERIFGVPIVCFFVYLIGNGSPVVTLLAWGFAAFDVIISIFGLYLIKKFGNQGLDNF